VKKPHQQEVPFSAQNPPDTISFPAALKRYKVHSDPVSLGIHPQKNSKGQRKEREGNRVEEKQKTALPHSSFHSRRLCFVGPTDSNQRKKCTCDNLNIQLATVCVLLC